ncbi:tetratricopeptide repeat protein [Pedomonas mirosovicensis]|uniref:tetratricopeptide repeat protein n=1 Tax=Pedomonas mirosovicensis TaxID=2908641 RepID=UPI002169E1B7|nr:tetratricopeptide repeat protein [Pedomonas mirosovicensis]MCH8686334.1 tetratricopeptide repeat protein [Pedomonas mirosovicensis]
MKRAMPVFLAVPLMFSALAAGAAPGDGRAAPLVTADYHLIRSGDLETAERILTYAHDSRENNPAKMLNLAYVLQKKGEAAQAASIYQEILRLDANPYVVTASGEPRRAKALARLGLERLDSGSN